MRIIIVSCFIKIMLSQGLSAQQADILPRPEYPRPQFVRSEWINLNGLWTYTFDNGKSGKHRDFKNYQKFENEIIVPFCPESELSGVVHKDFIDVMWYQRSIEVPESWQGNKIILHFGAVDYFAEVYIDGESIGKHWGGTSSFSFDVSNYVSPGKKHNLVVYVEDDIRSKEQASGKQSSYYYSINVKYTRVTGIWQTVWMEPVPEFGLESCHVVPDLDQENFIFTPRFYGLFKGGKLRVTIKDNSKIVASTTVVAANGIPVSLSVRNVKTWSPDSPFLYDLVYEIINENENLIDRVNSYTGMRKIHCEGNRIYLNNKQFYQRLVLDQGFYPKGIWTAPSDDALRKDIDLSMRARFNGARLHQKVFEARFHYWADKMGYVTWGESSNWGADINNPVAQRNFMSEWEEIIIRDRNHPSIIIWTPTNETWERGRATDGGKQHNRFLIDIYDLTHNLDPTRPVNDASGRWHQKTDIWTVHIYERDPKVLIEKLTPGEDGSLITAKSIDNGPRDNVESFEPPYSGQPYFMGEYGGRFFPGKTKKGEEYTAEKFYENLDSLTSIILSFNHICGYCYTQLTDVEQEKNGIYTYDRKEKFDIKRIRQIVGKERFK